MLSLSLMILESDFLRFFTQYREIEGWEDTALTWVFAAVIISACGTALMSLIKLFKKSTATNIKTRTWSSGRTWLLIVFGLFPVFFLTLVVWYFTRDFYNIIGFQGFIRGVVFACLLYLVMIVFVHVLTSWRNEIR